MVRGHEYSKGKLGYWCVYCKWDTFCNEYNGIDVNNKVIKLSSEIIQKFDSCKVSKILTVYILTKFILLQVVKTAFF